MSENSFSGPNDSHLSAGFLTTGYDGRTAGDQGDPAIASDGSKLGWQTDQHPPHAHETYYGFNANDPATSWQSGFHNAVNFSEDCSPDIHAGHRVDHPLPEINPSLDMYPNAPPNNTSLGSSGSYPVPTPQLIPIDEQTEGYQGNLTVYNDRYNLARQTGQDSAQTYATQPKLSSFESTPAQGFHYTSDYPGENLSNLDHYVTSTGYQYPHSVNGSTTSVPRRAHILHQTSAGFDQNPSFNPAPGQTFVDEQSLYMLTQADPPSALNPARIQTRSFGSNRLLGPARSGPSIISGDSQKPQPTLPSHYPPSKPSQGPEVNPGQVKRKRVGNSQEQKTRRERIKKLQCHICRKFFEKPSEVRRHVDGHERNFRFKCIECGERKVTKDQVVRHVVPKHLNSERGSGNPTEAERALAHPYVAALTDL